MTYEADPRVDGYIGALPAWQQAICREVRDLVQAEARRRLAGPAPMNVVGSGPMNVSLVSAGEHQTRIHQPLTA
jgi:hypothetical protein